MVDQDDDARAHSGPANRDPNRPEHRRSKEQHSEQPRRGHDGAASLPLPQLGQKEHDRAHADQAERDGSGRAEIVRKRPAAEAHGWARPRRLIRA